MHIHWRAGASRAVSGVNPFASLPPFNARITGTVPLKSRMRLRDRVLAIVVPWTLFGLYSGWQTHYRSALWGKPFSWGRSLYAEISYTWIWAILTPLVLWLAHRFPLPSPKWPRNVLVHLTAMFTFATFTKLAWDIVATPPNAFFNNGITYVNLLKSVLSALDSGTMLYCIIVLISYAAGFYREREEGRLRASELQRQFTDAQLAALKMQLHPHFLFNALHTISGLVHDDPHGAERMIARLSDFLRLSLEDHSIQEVTLREELRFLHLYLDIERVRFEDRLAVEFDLSPDVYDAFVPNLVLQPLVENCIRHGISHRISGGRIVVSGRREDDMLLLSVADNGPGAELNPMGPLREGVGLSNTRARLRRLYGERQQLTLRQPAEGGLDVRILIPFETLEADVRLEQCHARVDRG